MSASGCGRVRFESKVRSFGAVPHIQGDLLHPLADLLVQIVVEESRRFERGLVILGQVGVRVVVKVSSPHEGVVITMTELRVATRGMGKAKGVPELMRQPANPPVHATWCLVEAKTVVLRVCEPVQVSAMHDGHSVTAPTEFSSA